MRTVEPLGSGSRIARKFQLAGSALPPEFLQELCQLEWRFNDGIIVTTTPVLKAPRVTSIATMGSRLRRLTAQNPM